MSESLDRATGLPRARALDRAIWLCDDLTDRDLLSGRVGRWSWGPALLGFALTELEAWSPTRAGQPRYDRWLRTWVDHHARAGVRVDQSDRTAPGLVTRVIAERTQDPAHAALTDQVLRYLREEPRLVDDVTNHLGPSLVGRFYPRSVWVDSLMMFGVFAAIHGRATGDEELVELAARQPEQYARLLQDPATGLWSHSWWASSGKPLPARVFWGRGNGWVLASLPMIVEAIGVDHPRADRIAEIFASTSRAMLQRQRIDGAFNTVLNARSARELSAAALAAAGWFCGVRLGLLDRRWLEPAERALSVVTGAVHRAPSGRVVLPELSGPTIPVPLLPRTGYRVVPRGTNHDHGVAAFVLAAVNQARWQDFVAGQEKREPGLS